MPDKKLTDSEIVKALECCIKDDCVNCPLDTNQKCLSIYQYALDLINRLQAKNERLKKAVNRLTNRVCNLKEKDETRHKVFETKCEELEIAKAENERLDKENKHYAELEQGCYVTGYKNIKAEAYKECIDMVKKKGVKVGVDEICIFESTLDNLLKEMVGEDNAEEKE